MGEKIIVGPVGGGLRNNVTAFNIDNDSFSSLINSYQWRGRIRRKRGTSFLTRLRRFFNSVVSSYTSTPTINLVGGAANLITGFGLSTNASFVPGSISITDTTTSIVYQDPGLNGILVGVLSPTSLGTINYATGDITIVGGLTHAINASFLYYPSLPVLGEEDFEVNSVQFPGTIAFDNKYSYNVLTAFPYPNYDVSFYKNPAASASLPGYVPKTNETPTSWNGQDYQQFWSTNYQGAMLVTNGIDVPFTGSTIGMQFKIIGAITTTATTATMTITAHGLFVGDFVFINEVPSGITGINFQTGYVTTVTNANTVIVTFPYATLTGTATGGIAQYLTNRSDITKDCLRFYDGDPTNGNVTNPSLTGNLGWVNFCPPLSQSIFSIAEVPIAQYYLVGARMIIPFKDRILFFGPVIQTSSGSPIYLQDTVIYSQNGTPYYTSSFTATTNYPLPPVTTPPSYFPILVPINQTATPSAYFEDQTGFGGFQSAGIDQPLITAANNGDVILCGFDTAQARLVYTGNDIVPFNFFLVDSELGSGSTFSVINMGRGVLSRGSRGYVNTTQERAVRFDPDIPDEVFQIRLTGNGTERMCAQRDFINEWIHFTYTGNQTVNKFPNTTLQYNYKDDSWAIFYESYTHYGQFRKQTGFTWQTVGLVYPSWEVWNDPWNAGSSTLLQPDVIAGNQQGFIMVRNNGTGEGTSLYIQGFTGNTVTSPNHNLDTGDYIIISGCMGTVGTYVNGEIFSVLVEDANSFILNPTAIPSGATYIGGGLMTRMYVPYIQTKQFAPSWGISRKTRIGVQQYMLTSTDDAQMQLLIFLSQNSADAYNEGNIVPENNVVNNSLIYSTTLFTCPESTNIGLTPANINLNMVTAIQQSQIWHRINTSLIGDSVQLGFTISDVQMRDIEPSGNSFAITGANKATQCVLTCAGQFSSGQLIQISGIVGMIQLNGNTYQVVSSNSTTVTINVDSTTFTTYVSGGSVVAVSGVNGFAEIELHGFIIDVTPSMVLA